MGGGLVLDCDVNMKRNKRVFAPLHSILKRTRTVSPSAVLICVLLLPEVLIAQSSILKTDLQSRPAPTLDVFLRGFPYDRYLASIAFTDFATLQTDRVAVWANYSDGDLFLYHLANKFVRAYPIERGNIDDNIAIGEAYLNASAPGIGETNRQVYEIIGYFILNRVAAYIQTLYRQREFDPGKSENAQLIARLRNDRIHLAFEESTFNKVKKNVQQGNWKYLFRRIEQKTKAKFPKWTKSTPQQQQQGKPVPDVQMLPYRAYYGLNGGYGYSIYGLQRRDNQPIGFALFMRRPEIGAQYLAHDASARFQAARQTGTRNGRLLVAATGGFTNDYQQPEGLAVENGAIANAVLMPDRHALVVVERNGGIRVINLTRKDVNLPLGINTSRVIANPLRDITAYADLITWCRTEKATVFQTQLLAFSDSMLINPLRASTTTAERRLLALVTDTKTEAVYHVIFDVPTPYALYQISLEVVRMLHARGFKVEALMNLDTGGQNVLYVYDDRGNTIHDVKGTRGSQETTNLILYRHY